MNSGENIIVLSSAGYISLSKKITFYSPDLCVELLMLELDADDSKGIALTCCNDL